MLTKSRDVARVVREVLGDTALKEQYTDREHWNEIFTRVFDTPPTDDNDPRWEILFRADSRGLCALHAAMNLNVSE